MTESSWLHDRDAITGTIAQAIRQVIGIRDALGRSGTVLEGDPSVLEWAESNKHLALQMTSVHEFIQALLRVELVDTMMARRARNLWRLSRDTYPHVPEPVPIALLLKYLVAPGGLEDFWPMFTHRMRSFLSEPIWVTESALRILAGELHVKNSSTCIYLSLAQLIAESPESGSSALWPPIDIDQVPSVPFGPLAEELEDDDEYEPCYCLLDDSPGHGDFGDFNELKRVLASKGFIESDLFVYKSWLDARMKALTPGAWQWEPREDITEAIGDSFSITFEPSPNRRFDEAITITFRVGELRVHLCFGVPSPSPGISRSEWVQSWRIAVADLRELVDQYDSMGRSRNERGDVTESALPTLRLVSDEITGEHNVHGFHLGRTGDVKVLNLHSWPAVVGAAKAAAAALSSRSAL